MSIKTAFQKYSDWFRLLVIIILVALIGYGLQASSWWGVGAVIFYFVVMELWNRLEKLVGIVKCPQCKGRGKIVESSTIKKEEI